MYMKILGLYKGLKDNNKKGIHGHIILCLSITYIFLFVGIIIGALGYENIMLCAYAFFTICTFITCILSYRLVNNCFENNTKDYNDNVLDPFENKLGELKIGNNKSIERLIEQCKEYEMVEKDAGLKNFKYILGIAIIPLITSAGTLIISKMDDEVKIVIFLFTALIIGVGYVILSLLYDSYIKFIYQYNDLAKSMRYDLELILAKRES